MNKPRNKKENLDKISDESISPVSNVDISHNIEARDRKRREVVDSAENVLKDEFIYNPT